LTALGVLRMLPVLQRLGDAYTVSSFFCLSVRHASERQSMRPISP